MTMLVTVPTAVIQSAAVAVVEAEAEAERTTAARQAAEAKVDELRERLVALEQRKGEIIARRQQADCRDSDAGDLALIAADSEGLASLLAEANAAFVSIRQAAETAGAALAQTRDRLRRAEDEVLEGKLLDHVRRLDELMLAAIAEIEAVDQRLGRPVPSWGASAALREKIRRLTLLRREA